MEWEFGRNDIDAPWHPIYLAGLLEPAEVHQAAGMVSAQLAVSPQQAIARLRGTAALADQPVIQVAEAVIAREMSYR